MLFCQERQAVRQGTRWAQYKAKGVVMVGKSWFFRKAALFLLVGLAWVGSSAAVQAASSYSVWYNADVLAYQDRTISFSGYEYPDFVSPVYLQQTSITSPEFSASATTVVHSFVDWTQEAGATWNGTAELGRLSGSSTSNASVSPVTATLNTTTYNNPNSSSGRSGPATTGGLGWSDTATIISDTLATGAAVDLLFTLRMDSLIDLTGAPLEYLDTGNRAFADSRFTLGSPGGILLSMKQDTGAYGWSNSASTLVTTGLGSSSNEISRILHTTVGAALEIGGWLSTYAVSGARYQKPDMAASATANSYFFVDVLTTGASYYTASGTSYASPVPLPGAIWLLGSGLAGLAGFARRNSKR